MPHKFLENIAIADIAFEAKAKTLDKLFEECALAIIEQSVNPKTLSAKTKKKKTLKLKADSVEKLLHDFLSELIFLKDSKQLLFKKIQAKVVEKKENEFELTANCFGEKINQKKHELRNDIKAVTLHLFEAKKTRNGWFARIVLDV